MYIICIHNFPICHLLLVLRTRSWCRATSLMWFIILKREVLANEFSDLCRGRKECRRGLRLCCMVVLLGFNSSPSRVIFLKTFPSSAILYRSVKFPGKAQTHSPFLHTKQILNIDRLVTCIKPLKCTLLNFLCKITGG